MKNKWLRISICIIIGLMFFVFILPNQSFFLTLSDVYFLVSALLLVIGLFSWILKDGTFDFFHYSVTKAKDKLLSSQDGGLTNSDEDRLHRLSRSIPSFYSSFLKAGTLLLICSIVCTMIYYLLNI